MLVELQGRFLIEQFQILECLPLDWSPKRRAEFAQLQTCRHQFMEVLMILLTQVAHQSSIHLLIEQLL
jgi:hypothetical protein